jgi:hypothetical protein
MGQLKQDTKYIYEHSNGITYAREFGEDPSTRKIIGMSLKETTLHDNLLDAKLWGNIKRAAEDNPALQKALDQCILLYKLTADYEKRYGNSKT